ncbi:hypothetical protein Golomagni_07436, partial [Golovinomyces magnicellulatus]
ISVKTLSAPRQGPCNAKNLWDKVVKIEVGVKNVGKVAGQEVAQLYLGIPNSPPKQLRGFDKLSLEPGKSGKATFELTRRDLSVWDVVSQKWVVQAGTYKIYAGASSRDIRLNGSLAFS